MTGKNIATPTNWAYTTQFVGFTPTAPIPFAPVESSTMLNVTFIYDGASSTPGFVTIPGFTLESTIGNTGPGTFTALATRVINNTPAENAGVILVPTSVPEPASMLLIGGGLVALAVLRRKLVRH